MNNYFYFLIVGMTLLSCNPKTSQYYFNSACAKEAVGNYEGAINDLDIALSKKPNDIECYLNRGVDKKCLGKFAEAILDYEEALKIDSNCNMALYNKGIALFQLGYFQEALLNYNSAIVNKGGLYFYAQELDNEFLNKRSSDVNMEEIRLQRGFVLTELFNYREAYKDFSFCINKGYSEDLASLWRGVCGYSLSYKKEACLDWSKSDSLGMKEATNYLDKYCN